MTGSSDVPPERISRRSVLAAGTAGLVAGTAGCVNQVQSMVSSDSSTDDDTSLRIITVPADNDRQAVQIARELEGNLEALDFNVSLDLRSNTEFQRSVMLDHDFDMYVGTLPTQPDPDFLYEMLHSSYKSETGHQNPFRFEDITTMDGLLTDQRESEETEAILEDLLVQIAREMPFVPICIPEGQRAVRPEIDLWDRHHPHSRLAYFGTDETPTELTSLIMDSRPTRNVNPFSTEHRNHGTYIDLLYDSLAIDTALIDADDERITERFEEANTVTPWLAESIEWDESELTVRIREDCQFHDGEPVTAEDIKFTYDFLADTSGGLADSPLPATNYRRHASTVESVTVVDDDGNEDQNGADQPSYEATITFETNRTVAERALLVPIIPKHVWGPEEGALAELDEDEIPIRQGRWSLLGSDDEELIVGSGPFRYEDNTERDSLTLERFDEHFTQEDDVGLPSATVETLEFLNDTSSASALQQVEGGVADVTTSRLEPHVVEDAFEQGNEDEIFVDAEPWTFYHIGFRNDSGLCQSQSFRNAVGRLIDREYVTEEIFSGRAEPIWTPVGNEDEEWLTEDELKDEAITWMNHLNIELEDREWDETQPFAPFCKADSDRPGQLDIEAAQTAFENAGFQYNEDGQIVDY